METPNVMGFVGALNDPLRGPTFHIASGCTTAAAPCASSSMRHPPSCVSRSSPSRWICSRKSPALSSSPRRSRTNVAASGAPSRSSRKSFLLGWDFARAGATATRVAEFMFDEGLAQGERPRDIWAWIEGQLHQPRYWPTDLRMARSRSCEESHGGFDLW